MDWDSELRGAGMLVKSGLVPRDVRSAEAALFIILAGRDLGLSAVQSLRSIRPVQGKIECSADLQLGLFHRDGGKTKWLKLDAEGAHLQLMAPWLSEPHVSRFGLEEAKRAGLMSNDNYRKYPVAMFRSRAITQGLKDIGFLMGAGLYAPGEIGGGVTIDPSTGEVLPGEQSESPLKHDDHTPLGGVVEALPDQAREALERTACAISEMVANGKLSAANELWQPLENDDKVAVWALLDKATRKALKAHKDSAKTKAETDHPPPAPAGPPSITLAKLYDAMRSRTDVDLLTADADLIRQLPADQQEEATAEYLRLKAALVPA